MTTKSLLSLCHVKSGTLWGQTDRQSADWVILNEMITMRSLTLLLCPQVLLPPFKCSSSSSWRSNGSSKTGRSPESFLSVLCQVQIGSRRCSSWLTLLFSKSSMNEHHLRLALLVLSVHTNPRKLHQALWSHLWKTAGETNGPLLKTLSNPKPGKKKIVRECLWRLVHSWCWNGCIMQVWREVPTITWSCTLFSMLTKLWTFWEDMWRQTSGLWLIDCWEEKAGACLSWAISLDPKGTVEVGNSHLMKMFVFPLGLA